MKIAAVFEVDEERLAATGGGFESETAWAEQSGIMLERHWAPDRASLSDIESMGETV